MRFAPDWMRILEAVSQIGRNGASIFARQLIPRLQARGHEVWLAAAPDSWIAQETAGQVRLVATDFARWPLAELRRVAEFCRAERIDVVHSHLTRAANFCALLRWLHDVPSVAHAHSSHFQPHWYCHDLMVAVSPQTLQRHRWRLAGLGSRGRVLPNFVDTERFAPARPGGGGDPLRIRLGLPADAPVVVQVGEISERKGQLTTLEAAARVRAACPGVRFVFLGIERSPPPYLAALQAVVARDRLAEAVVWAGRREDVAELLPWATVAVLPSLDEPFSLAGLEAMACGRPLIASNVGGFPEMVTAGVTGLLVPPRDATALAEALIGLLREPAKADAMGAAGRARALAEFGPETFMVRLEALLAEGAKRGR